ncbi:hypothetical protein I9S53_08175 [Hyphomicrobium sulfonivorans]|nr:hypothetical protein [Hyphomicrobium sulfonivorans]MBI1649857.1 hypothetical protein [Hyphomicrobium sulfonivorans]
MPAERLLIERQSLQPLSTLYGVRSIRSVQQQSAAPRKTIIGYQHPLSVYDARFPEVCS